MFYIIIFFFYNKKSYTIGIWVTIGPIIQLICQTMLKQNPKARMIMLSISVFISHFSISFFLLGLKVTAILRGGGNSSSYNSKFNNFYNEAASPNSNHGETFSIK